jgi:hypothetical protein
MSGLFGGKPKPKMPPKPDPQAIPEVSQEAADEAVKGQRRRRGYSSTIHAGKLAPSTGKKTALG